MQGKKRKVPCVFVSIAAQVVSSVGQRRVDVVAVANSVVDGLLGEKPADRKEPAVTSNKKVSGSNN